MDISDPAIMAAVRDLNRNISDPWLKITSIFNFVRDQVIYNFAPDIRGVEDFKASRIMQAKNGFCHQKAILLCTLLRAAGLPSALYFQDIIDYPLMKTRYKKHIPAGILYYHALGAVFIEGSWYRLDGTLDSALCHRRAYRLSKINKAQETLLPLTTVTGEKHFEISREYGFLEFYDPEFSSHILNNMESWKDWRKFVHREHLSM